MKHIFKKLHKNHEPNRANETLIPSTSATVSSTDTDPPLPSTPSQSQQLCSSDQTSSTSVQSPETPSSAPVPQAAPPVASVPTTLGGGVGDEGPGLGNHVDYFSSEEEFQMQLALAISASNSDIRDDPENDQIRAATLLSLGRAKSLSSVREKEVSGELLSRRYWDYNVLDYEEKVVDGFYDVYGLTVEPIVQGKMPCLADLETSPGDSGYEAIIVNRKIDPTLEELEQVARCIAIDCPPSEIGIRVQRLAELVTDHMGGSVRNPNIMLARWMDRSSELRTSLHTSVFPIGTLKTGISRHRALLFKVLADNVGIRCRLIKGSHYTGVEEDAVNIIKLEDGREFLVDLMAAPGTLLPTDVLSAKDLTQPSNQKLDRKAPYGQESSGCGTLHPEGKALVSNSIARANDSAESKLLVSGNTTFETSGPSHHDTGTGPTRINSKLNSANQMEFPSTSAVGASLYKANRGPLAVGDGSKLRMNVNVVPNYQNNVDESRKLFADLNPFQIGGGRLMQNKPPDYRLDEPRRQKSDTVSSNHPPRMWKNRHVVNEAPKKKEYNFPEGLPPRNCGDTSGFLNKVSLPVQSCSTSSDNNYANISKRNLDSAQPSRCQDVERFHNVPSIAAVAKHSDTLLVGGKKYTQDYTQGQAIESDNMSNQRKGYDHRVIGPQDHQKGTFNRFMDTSLLPNEVGSGLPNDCGPCSVDTGIDDVGECEIPWEDLDLGERIGLGSYGEVYRADWNGTEVAVKKFLDQDFSGAALAEFKREVRIMRRLRHPNVVLFMGAVTRPPNLSIITEFLPRGSLYRLIHRPNCQIDEKHRIKMALDVARGMNCLHSSTPTIVHRDLKSPNLLVDNSWNVKVCDFGLSRLKHNTFLSSKSTAGTPEWMAPEVLRNEPSNEKCDIYSFGVILWELATLRLPWSGMNPMQVVGAVGFQNRRLEIPKEVDPLVARIIWECWQTDPNLRPSFAQLCVALKPLQLLVIPSTNSDQQSSSMHQEISVNSTP